jgi:hypothetical protein
MTRSLVMDLDSSVPTSILSCLRRRFTALATIIFVIWSVCVPSAQERVVTPQRPVVKGELVVVSLRDGRSVTGTVGEWVDELGFQVFPSSGPPYFVRQQDVLAIRLASDGTVTGLPSPPHRMSTSKKILIGVGIGLGVPFAIFLITCAASRGHCQN